MAFVVLALAGATPLLSPGLAGDFLFYFSTFGISILALCLLCLIGLMLAWPLFGRQSPAPLAISSALGIGLLGWIFSFCLLLHVPFTIVFVACLAIASWSAWRYRPWTRSFSIVFQGSEVAAIAMLAMGFSMALLASLTPAVSYDVLEYHLPLVRHFLATRWLGIIPYNFYTQLPSGTEALFALGAWLSGTESACKIMNFALLCITASLVYSIARELKTSVLFSLLAVCHFVLHPTTLRISVDAFADMGTACFVLASAYALIQWSREQTLRWSAMAGFLGGLALGTKSSVAGLFIAPVILFLFLPVLIHQSAAGTYQIRLGLLHLGAFAFCAFLGFLPWMIRGAICTGNPLSPFLNSVFGQDAWQAQTEKLWLQMHGWTPPFSSTHLEAMWHKAALIGWPWIGGALAALLIGPRLRRALALVGLAGYFTYALLTQAPDRFAEPIIALFIILAAVAASHLSSELPAARRFFVFIFFVLLWNPLWRSMQNMTASHNIEYAVTANREAYLNGGFAADKAPLMAYSFFHAADQLPPKSRVLLLYDAQTYEIARPVQANTVFDKSPLLEILRNGQGGSLSQKLRAAGFTHIMVNEAELAGLLLRQASPTTAANPLYQNIRSTQDPALRNRQLVNHLEWYLPYERMRVTPVELQQIAEFTNQSAQHPLFIETAGGVRRFLSEIK